MEDGFYRKILRPVQLLKITLPMEFGAKPGDKVHIRPTGPSTFEVTTYDPTEPAFIRTVVKLNRGMTVGITIPSKMATQMGFLGGELISLIVEGQKVLYTLKETEHED